MAAPAGPPLSGVEIVDLSSGIAGAYCTKLLADGGATVIKLEGPGGDPLRRWSASGASIPPGRDGALFSFLAGGKQSVIVDPGGRGQMEVAHSYLAGADIVVWSPGTDIA